MKTVIEMIADERKRQIEEEGWTAVDGEGGMMAANTAIYTGMIVLHQHQCCEVIGLSGDNSTARLEGVSELVPVALLAPANMSDIAAERMIMAEREDEHEFFQRLDRILERDLRQPRLFDDAEI